MRVLLQGGTRQAQGALARALARGGCTVSRPDETFDLLVTLGEGDVGLIRRGALAIDVARSQAEFDGRAARLSRMELAILVHLARIGRPADRGALLEAVWGYRFDPGTNIVAVHVSRLRSKLGADLIVSTSAGYALAVGTADGGVTPD